MSLDEKLRKHKPKIKHLSEDQIDEICYDADLYYKAFAFPLPLVTGLASAAVTYWGFYGGNAELAREVPFCVGFITMLGTLVALGLAYNKFEDWYVERERRKRS